MYHSLILFEKFMASILYATKTKRTRDFTLLWIFYVVTHFVRKPQIRAQHPKNI